MISLIKIIEDTTVDGPGFRTAVYAAGCPNACPGCHNPRSWSIESGRLTPVADIFDVIRADDKLARMIKEQTHKNIWCYTGYTFERLLRNESQRALLEWIDVLVDGPYVEAQRDPDLLFRGSRNQRLIDVPASLRSGQVTLFHTEL